MIILILQLCNTGIRYINEHCVFVIIVIILVNNVGIIS